MSIYKLGVMWISDNVPKKLQDELEEQADAIMVEAVERFDKWLDEHGLESVMGMVMQKRKGSGE